MKRFFYCIVLLLLASNLLIACGGGNSSSSGQVPPDYTGDFLSWTGMDDAAHFFTLVRVNGKTGAVTNIGGFDFFTSLEYSPDGTLYGISDELRVINPANGSTGLVGTFQFEGSSPILMTGAAFSPSGTLYVMENATPSRVFTVNLTNAALTSVGTPTAMLSDMEFASDGTLYGGFADLFTLNAVDMSTMSTVGHPEPSWLESLTFDSNGTLFGIDAFPSTHIYSLSLVDGSATPVVTTGSTGLVSLVAGRAPASAAAGLNFNKAVAMNLFSVPQSQKTLINKECAIKAAHKGLQ